MNIYKTISTTHIAIIGIKILFRECVVVHSKIPTTHAKVFKSPSMTNGEKEYSSPINADNSSSDFYSGSDFLLLPGQYGGLDGVSFDDRRNYMHMNVNSR